MVFVPIVALRKKFACGSLRYSSGGPNLTMGMGIASSHHLAPILEDLNVVNTLDTRQFLSLRAPLPNHRLDFMSFHRGQREIVAGRKAHHTADSRLGFSDEEAATIHIEARGRDVLPKCCEVILKNES
jgi:hypothetical protein